MADSDSSDVLANLPAGRPTRRSTRRAPQGEPGGASAKPAAATAAAKKPAARKAAAKKAPAKKAPAKKAAAKKAPAKEAAAKKPAAKKAAAKKAAARPKPVPVSATTAGETAAHAQRRPRIQTPPEGRRGDYSGGASTHRARRVTTNRPWLPASGFVLPEEKEGNQLASALGGLGSALADVARLSFGIAQSLTVRRREIEAPEETSLTED